MGMFYGLDPTRRKKPDVAGIMLGFAPLNLRRRWILHPTDVSREPGMFGPVRTGDSVQMTNRGLIESRAPMLMLRSVLAVFAGLVLISGIVR
jgi:hypothetical protein